LNPALKTVEDVEKHFAPLVGEKPVFRTGTGRPYIRIANKGDASLFLNVVLESFEYKEKPVRGVVARFFQTGGVPTSFAPPLKVRAEGNFEGTKLFRLSKLNFALCDYAHPAPITAWHNQKVTLQLVEWLQGVVQFASATPVGPEVLAQIVELTIPSADKVSDAKELFSLDPFDGDDKNAKAVPSEGDAEEADEPDEDVEGE
jgi:hypothetical protein